MVGLVRQVLIMRWMLISLGSPPQINVLETNTKTSQARWPMTILGFSAVLLAGVGFGDMLGRWRWFLQVGWISAQKKWVDDNDQETLSCFWDHLELTSTWNHMHYEQNDQWLCFTKHVMMANYIGLHHTCCICISVTLKTPIRKTLFLQAYFTDTLFKMLKCKIRMFFLYLTCRCQFH